MESRVNYARSTFRSVSRSSAKDSRLAFNNQAELRVRCAELVQGSLGELVADHIEFNTGTPEFDLFSFK